MAKQIVQLTPAPQRNDALAIFPTIANAHVASLTGFVDDANAVGVEANANATQAELDAASAAANGTAAEANADFAGVWASLTGSLSVPSTVFHDDDYWRLLVNLADVTTSEPGVTSDYIVITDLSNISLAKINNPILSAFKKNSLTNILVGSFTWTRSTTATFIDRYGVVQTAAIDTPREEAEGFLREGASTNLAIRSEEFDNASWSKIQVTLTPNAIAAPDGTTTADKMVSVATADMRVLQSEPITSGTPFALSVFAKAAEFTSILLFLDTGSAAQRVKIEVDLTDGSIITPPTINGTVFSNVFGGVVTLKNGWFRIFIGGTPNASSTGRMNIALIGTGDASSGIYIWGAHLEALNLMSSYIPTTTVAVSRGADDPSVQVDSNFISQTEGDHTQVMTFSLLGDTGSPQRLYTALAIGGSNARYLTSVASSTGLTSYSDGSSTTGNSTSSALSGEVTLVTVTEAGVLKTYFNGVLESSTANTLTDALDTTVSLDFGHAVLAEPMFGHISGYEVFDAAFNSDEASYVS